MYTQYKVLALFIQAVCFVPSLCFAAFDRVPQPVSLIGRGISGVAICDPSFVWINPAAAAGVSSFSSTLFYTPSPFGVKQLRNTGLLIAEKNLPVKSAIGVTSFGFSLYRETVGTAAMADTISGSFLAGIALNIDHLKIASYGSETTIGIDIGAILPLTKRCTVGISISNVNRPAIGGIDNSIVQTMTAGAAYDLDAQSNISVDLVKDTENPMEVRTGIQFQPHKSIILRCGFETQTKKLHGGISVLLSIFRIEYAIVTHPDLGLTHSFGISMAL